MASYCYREALVLSSACLHGLARYAAFDHCPNFPRISSPNGIVGLTLHTTLALIHIDLH